MFKKSDFLPSIFWMGVSIAVLVKSYYLQLGTFGYPGPGMMPFLLGIGLFVCSGFILIKTIHLIIRKKCAVEGSVWTNTDIKKVSYVVSTLIGYGLILETLGFIITTFIMLTILFKVVEDQKWSLVLFKAILTVSVTYILFDVLLDVELPHGILGRI